MTRLIWDQVGERHYEAGVDRGVLYVGSSPGVNWNGLISIEEKPSGGTANPYYLDGFKYLNFPSVEEFEATLKALSSPLEFDVCDGTASLGHGLFLDQQPRIPFGLCYRTKLGSDVSDLENDYKIHLLYNVLSTPSNVENVTLDKSSTNVIFSWDLTTSPIIYSGTKPGSHFTIIASQTHPELLEYLEGVLYGTETTPPRMLSFSEIINLFVDFLPFEVLDICDGKYRAQGIPVIQVPTNKFTINHETVIDNLDGSFTILDATDGDCDV